MISTAVNNFCFVLFRNDRKSDCPPARLPARPLAAVVDPIARNDAFLLPFIGLLTISDSSQPFKRKSAWTPSRGINLSKTLFTVFETGIGGVGRGWEAGWVGVGGGM